MAGFSECYPVPRVRGALALRQHGAAWLTGEGVSLAGLSAFIKVIDLVTEPETEPGGVVLDTASSLTPEPSSPQAPETTSEGRGCARARTARRGVSTGRRRGT